MVAIVVFVRYRTEFVRPLAVRTLTLSIWTQFSERRVAKWMA